MKDKKINGLFEKYLSGRGGGLPERKMKEETTIIKEQ